MENEQLKRDIEHILESGANEIRLIELFNRHTTQQVESAVKLALEMASEEANMLFHPEFTQEELGQVEGVPQIRKTADNDYGNFVINKQSILSLYPKVIETLTKD